MKRTWKVTLVAVISGVVAAASLVAAPTAAWAAGTTYYVDASTGSDSNAGTSPATAWQSLSKVAATTLSAGDQVLFHAGQTWAGQLKPKGNGVAGSPIVISSYGTGGRPVIDGGSLAKGGAVYIKNESYVTVQNLEVVNNSGVDNLSVGTGRMGIYVDDEQGGTIRGIVIQNNYVHNVNGCFDCSDINGHDNGGIVVAADNYSVVSLNADSFDGVQVLNNTVDGVGRTGIIFEDISSGYLNWVNTNSISHNVTISGNSVSNSQGDGITVRGAQTVHIDHNVVTNSGLKTADAQNQPTSAGLWVARTIDTTIEYNEVSGTRLNQADGQGYDIDLSATNTTVQYNYSHDNEGGFILLMFGYDDAGKNATVRYNLSVNDGTVASNGTSPKGVFTFSFGVKANTNIYNNTIYVAAGHNSNIMKCDSCNVTNAWSFRNNIIANFGTGGYGYPTAGATIDSNTFYGVHPATEPADAHKLTVDPQFVAASDTAPSGIGNVSGYEVASTSPMVGTGAVIASNGGVDYFGDTVSSTAAPTRGFFEAQSF